MTAQPDGTCASCNKTFPYKEFTRFYTLLEAVRKGYGKPFDPVAHAHIPENDRTEYARIPQRVAYQCKYCRTCKPQRPFVDTSSEVTLKEAAGLGAFGPHLTLAIHKVNQLLDAKRIAANLEREARAPGRLIRPWVVNTRLRPVIDWQHTLALQKYGKYKEEMHQQRTSGIPSSSRRFEEHCISEYIRFYQSYSSFWSDLRVLIKDPDFKLPRRLVLERIDPLHADEREPDVIIDTLKASEKNGDRKYVLYLLLKAVVKQGGYRVGTLERLRREFGALENAAPTKIKKPLGLVLYDLILDAEEDYEDVPNNPGPYVHDPDDPKSMTAWIYADERYRAYMKRRGQQTNLGARKNEQRIAEGKKHLGRPRKKK